MIKYKGDAGSVGTATCRGAPQGTIVISHCAGSATV
jgi:hypothetical protein